MPYPIGPKTESGWPYTCVRCGASFFKPMRVDMKYCPDCSSHGDAEQKRRYLQRLRAEQAERREARLGTGPAGGTDYCKRMHMTNPGAMCGTRDFCIGCEFAGDGKCRDNESFWGV
jgi:hypothetical protein